MIESEFVNALIARHNYPVDDKQLQSLTAMYRSVRDGADALGILMGISDAAPASRFSAAPDTPLPRADRG